MRCRDLPVFLEKVAPFEMDGLYLCRYYSDHNMVNAAKSKSLIENLVFYSTNSYFYEHYLFF